MRTFLLIGVFAAGLVLAPVSQVQAMPTGAQPAVAAWHSLIDGLTSFWNQLVGSVPWWASFDGEGGDDGPTGDLAPFTDSDGVSWERHFAATRSEARHEQVLSRSSKPASNDIGAGAEPDGSCLVCNSLGVGSEPDGDQ